MAHDPLSPAVAGVRRLAVVGLVGAALTVLAGVLVASVVQPASDISTTQFSYPWSSGAQIPVSIVSAAMHLLVLVGLVGLARSGVCGTGHAARIGGALAVLGTAIFALAELATIPVRSDRVGSAAVTGVIAIFALFMVVSVVGFVLLTVSMLRSGAWDGWRRWTPLAQAVVVVITFGLSATTALAVGVAAYALTQVALFVALATRPLPDVRLLAAPVDTPPVRL